MRNKALTNISFKTKIAGLIAKISGNSPETIANEVDDTEALNDVVFENEMTKLINAVNEGGGGGGSSNAMVVMLDTPAPGAEMNEMGIYNMYSVDISPEDVLDFYNNEGLVFYYLKLEFGDIVAYFNIPVTLVSPFDGENLTVNGCAYLNMDIAQSDADVLSDTTYISFTHATDDGNYIVSVSAATYPVLGNASNYNNYLVGTDSNGQWTLNPKDSIFNSYFNSKILNIIKLTSCP